MFCIEYAKPLERNKSQLQVLRDMYRQFLQNITKYIICILLIYFNLFKIVIINSGLITTIDLSKSGYSDINDKKSDRL